MANANPPNGQSPPEPGDEITNIDGQEKQKEDFPETEQKPKLATIIELELEQYKREANEYKDKYLRLLAETENARKRLQKERQEMTQYAVQNVIVDFLTPIDHMENALKYTQQMSDEVKHWASGFQMILNQFKDVLSSNGVIPYKSEGTPFDPHCHEAIEMIETNDVPSGIVVEESLLGYKMGDKIIRPARVKVSKALPIESGTDENLINEENK